MRNLARISCHSIIHVPISNVAGGKAPVLLLPNGERCFELLHYTRHRIERGFAMQTVCKDVDAIGLFLDYYFLVRNGQRITGDQVEGLLEAFRNARKNGCPALGWPPVSDNTADLDVELISAFFDYCSDAFGYKPINPVEEVHLSDLQMAQQIQVALAERYKREGMLGHLYSRTRAAEGVVLTRRSRKKTRGRKPKRATAVRSFPPDRVEEMIINTPSTRDKLILILIFFGGIRISELCHLFYSDVLPSPDKTGAAQILLAHPEKGLYTGPRRFGGTRNVERQVFLSEDYKRTPRNKLNPRTDSLYAGWKGMTYDTKGFRSHVYWSDFDWGQIFYLLHLKYMQEVEKIPAGLRNHPYYFINMDAIRSRDKWGAPLTLDSIKDLFYRACKRIGLDPNEEDGVHPHGGRHFYGFTLANELKLSRENAQKAMHHADISSTEVYFKLTVDSVYAAIRDGFERRRVGKPELITKFRSVI